MKPRLLRPDNLTPPTRTPWGGRRILGHYKSDPHHGLTSDVAPVVGESWEVSVEPSFPSRFADDDTLLSDAIATDPVGWLGPLVAGRHGGQTPLLIKLLDADDALSVQVHPADGDPALADDESGKPEGWIVLDARPGAGLYLGFKQGVRRDDVARCLAKHTNQEPLDALMNFVPVTAGDVFVIAAGTVHAIGAGVTLVEPQFVAPGRRGVTYRLWDWNRRYDLHGRRDPAGQPRELHVARSLAVTDWSRGGGEAFVTSCRARAVRLEDGPVTRTRLIDWPWFITERWRGTGTLRVAGSGTMLALTAVAGAATIQTPAGAISLRRGQSAVVPAKAGAIELDARDLDLLVTSSPVAVS